MATRACGRHQHGFTLLELVTAVLIVGILMTIALPTFLGARRPASDRAAMTLARNAMVAARSALADTDTYAGFGPATLAASENTITFVDGTTPAAASRTEVSVAVGTTGADSWVILASGSTSGRCFALYDGGEGQPGHLRTDTPTCRAADFGPADPWEDAWP
jgi:type IV pilus assembly protein PilA